MLPLKTILGIKSDSSIALIDTHKIEYPLELPTVQMDWIDSDFFIKKLAKTCLLCPENWYIITPHSWIEHNREIFLLYQTIIKTDLPIFTSKDIEWYNYDRMQEVGNQLSTITQKIITKLLCG